MTQLERSFEVKGRPQLEVTIPAGHVVIREDSSVTITVTGSDRALDAIEIEQFGSMVSVRMTRSGRRMFMRNTDVSVGLPAGADILIKTGSGDVEIGVAINDLEVKVGSGDVRVSAPVADALIKSASGHIVVDQVGMAQVTAASGDIRIDKANRDVVASTASGDVVLGSFDRDATLKSASGDLSVGVVDGDELNAKTMSGNIRIGLPTGLSVDATLQSYSGSIRNELEPADGDVTRSARIRAKTLSGDIVLRSA